MTLFFGKTADNEYYTPKYAINLLKPYLPNTGVVWEAFTQGNNELIESPTYLRECGYEVITSTNDFFEWEPKKFDYIITNPPYHTPRKQRNIKERVIERCCELGKPFALCIPTLYLQTKSFKSLQDKYGRFQLLLPSKKFQFYKIKDNKYNRKSDCNFYTCWLTRGFNLQRDFIII